MLKQGVADLANKRRKVEIQFRVIKEAMDPSGGGPGTKNLVFMDHSIDPERSLTGGNVEIVDSEELLETHCLIFNDKPYTVDDIIEMCRNVEGGFGHFAPTVDSISGRAERTGNDSRKALARLNRMIRIKGTEPTVRKMVSICRVVLKGLAPLERAIREEPE